MSFTTFRSLHQKIAEIYLTITISSETIKLKNQFLHIYKDFISLYVQINF